LCQSRAFLAGSPPASEIRHPRQLIQFDLPRLSHFGCECVQQPRLEFWVAPRRFRLILDRILRRLLQQMLDQLQLSISRKDSAPMGPYMPIGLADDSKRENGFGRDQQLRVFSNPRLELVQDQHRHFDGDAAERSLGQA